MIPESLFRTSPVITRYPEPVLTSKDVPYDSNLTFNAGVVKENGRYIMLFRNDYGCTREQFEKDGRNFAGTNIGLAFSDDGIHCRWKASPCWNCAMRRSPAPTTRALPAWMGSITCALPWTRVMACAAASSPPTISTILRHQPQRARQPQYGALPEKIGGKYVRLERPMPVYSTGGHFFDIWLSDSPDLAYWGNSAWCSVAGMCPSATTRSALARRRSRPTRAGW